MKVPETRGRAGVRRLCAAGAAAGLYTTDSFAGDRCLGNLRDCLGDAAFGLPQTGVLVATLAVVFVTFGASLVTRRFWIGEIAFVAAVAGGLLSNAIGMIILTVASLASVLTMGWIADRFGIRGELSADEIRAIGNAVDTTIRDDLGADAGAAHRAAPPPRSQP